MRLATVIQGNSNDPSLRLVLCLRGLRALVAVQSLAHAQIHALIERNWLGRTGLHAYILVYFCYVFLRKKHPRGVLVVYETFVREISGRLAAFP